MVVCKWERSIGRCTQKRNAKHNSVGVEVTLPSNPSVTLSLPLSSDMWRLGADPSDVVPMAAGTWCARRKGNVESMNKDTTSCLQYTFGVISPLEIFRGIVPRLHRFPAKEAAFQLLDTSPGTCHARELDKDANAAVPVWPDEYSLHIAVFGAFVANLTRQLVVDVGQIDHVLEQDDLAWLQFTLLSSHY